MGRMDIASGGFRLLQMVSKLGIEQCASKDTESRRGVDCEISHRLKRGTSVNEDTGPKRE